MKKRALTFAIFLLTLLGGTFAGYSQVDSTRIDAGQLVLNKSFTQGIRIRGEDLEKMPFTNLADALSAWAYGIYMVPGNIMYVVDGNPLADANAYSIHDIQEVLVVQNASVEMNTAGGQQMVAVVTTRRGARPGVGLTLSGRAGIVGAPNAKTGVYDQYYAGIARRAGAVEYGASFDYVHDTWPSSKANGVTTQTPFNMDRQRFSGWMRWRADRHNTVDVNANFTWQNLDSAKTMPYQTNMIFSNNSHETQHLFTPSVRWHGGWGGFSHDLQAGYVAELHKSDITANWKNSGNTAVWYTGLTSIVQHTDHVFVRERLGYRFVTGGWVFEPAVNGSYEHVRNRYQFSSIYYTGTTPSGSVNTQWQKGHIWLLTPSLDIRYKQVLDLQGGIMANLSPREPNVDYAKVVRVFPFASLGFDVLQAVHTGNKSSLKLYGSYVRRSSWSVNDYALNDLTQVNDIFNGTPTLKTVYSTGTVGYYGAPPASPDFWAWHTGAGYMSANGRLQVSYSFERRNLYTLLALENPIGLFYWEQLSWNSGQHYLGIDGKILAKEGMVWRSGVHAAIWSNQAQSAYADASADALKVIGDRLPHEKYTSVTGGWTNRLDLRALSFGLDLGYRIHEGVPDNVSAQTYKTANYFSVQHLFVAYRLPMHDGKTLEVYVNARGVPQHSQGTYMDNRRFVGAGAKMNL